MEVTNQKVVRKRRKFFSSEESKAASRERKRQFDQKRVSLGSEYYNWDEQRTKEGFSTNTAWIKHLLHVHERCCSNFRQSLNENHHFSFVSEQDYTNVDSRATDDGVLQSKDPLEPAMDVDQPRASSSKVHQEGQPNIEDYNSCLQSSGCKLLGGKQANQDLKGMTRLKTKTEESDTENDSDTEESNGTSQNSAGIFTLPDDIAACLPPGMDGGVLKLDGCRDSTLDKGVPDASAGSFAQLNAEIDYLNALDATNTEDLSACSMFYSAEQQDKATSLDLPKSNASHNLPKPRSPDHMKVATPTNDHSSNMVQNTSEEQGPKIVKKKSKQGTKKHKCEYCDRVFTRRFALTEHERIHTGEQPYCCDLCGKFFSQRSTLYHHKRGHVGEKPFKCDYCDKSFRAKCYLEDHIRTHTGERPHSCEFCEKKFKKRTTLLQHRRIHLEEKPFKCSQCDEAFTTMTGLKVHEHNCFRSGEKPFRCHPCDLTFVNRSAFSEHLLVHAEEKTFECDQCFETFKSLSELRTHQHTHDPDSDKSSTTTSTTDETTGKPGFKCDECLKLFTLKSSLRVHKIFVHTQERPFQCGKCDRAFVKKTDFVRHQRVHTGEKPFKCDQCDKTFADGGNRLKHVRCVHSNIANHS